MVCEKTEGTKLFLNFLTRVKLAPKNCLYSEDAKKLEAERTERSRLTAKAIWRDKEKEIARRKAQSEETARIIAEAKQKKAGGNQEKVA